MKLSLVFPAYNEAASIIQVLERFSQYCRDHHLDHEILVVNDGSRDATGQRVKELIHQYPAIRLIEHPKNQGYGAALRSGFAAASGDYIFYTDSDGQFNTEALDQTLSLISPNTIILGYRRSRVEGLVRRLNAAVWGRWVGWLLGFRVRDLNCAWKIFPHSLLQNVTLVSNGAFISAELLYYAHKKNLHFREIPIRHWPRQAGLATGANPRVILYAFQELFYFLTHQKTSTQPWSVTP